ncbi:L,D-transpeptidase [Kaistia nematophila]|uniref:L,D-transpeptidase n=1 Tax=Kaistia nematophila TaxID=2994654 RepID=A0A9X3DZQ2_9HYPH|nr:L,D-transpeptidase [Kaistia nematophila]MCX5568411.1 L,D-transpeptidase [Kaistia nematophila]
MRDKAVQIFRKVLKSPLSLALLGCAAVVALAPAVPAEAGIRDMLNINEQPGVVPTKQESLLPPEFRPQPVYFRSNEPPGTIIINTDERFLYLVQSDNRAIRYGVGVGRDGFQWSGLLKISRKAEWPDWRPPAEMIQRQPYLPRFMAGGEGNPMGARALYLGDTIYRIHGTNQPQTIGHALSSGCFRMVNNDVMDLYERVPVGTKVIVRQQAKL